MTTKSPANSHRSASIRHPCTFPVSAKVFHTVTDGIGLKKLGSIKNCLKVSRISVHLLHIVHDFSIGAVISLVFFHHITENIPVCRIVCKCLNCLFTGNDWNQIQINTGKRISCIRKMVCFHAIPSSSEHHPLLPSFGSSKEPPEDGLAGQ